MIVYVAISPPVGSRIVCEVGTTANGIEGGTSSIRLADPVFPTVSTTVIVIVKSAVGGVPTVAVTVDPATNTDAAVG